MRIRISSILGTETWWENFIESVPDDTGSGRMANRDMLLRDQNARLYAPLDQPYSWPELEFDSEEDATLFLLRWS